MKIKKTTVFLLGSLVVVTIALIVFLMNAFPNRPQEPSAPYPYYTEDVSFKNTRANITLAGTLTLPSIEGNYPAVILISGSGPQNRDEEISGHRPFLVLADHLTKNGIVVLRYDDRGFARSTGNFSSATTVDFAADVESAIEFLKTRKEIDTTKIGLIGHSEGGIVAPMVATSSVDVSFIVLLAGPGIQLRELLTMQQELIPRAMGLPEADIQKAKALSEKAFQMIAVSEDPQTLKADLAKLLEDNYDSFPKKLLPPKIAKAQLIAMQSDMMSSEWYKNLLNYDPAPTLEKVSCRVLALNGEKDVQVMPKENLAGIKEALVKGGNTDVTIKELPNLNHLFQECETGSPTEYDKIEQTFSPVALTEISDWILRRVQ